jgi:hypothetical protein
MTRIDEGGKRYGKLHVIAQAVNRDNRNAKWLVRCDCGRFKITYGFHLRQGKARSCGCDAGRPRKKAKR